MKKFLFNHGICSQFDLNLNASHFLLRYALLTHQLYSVQSSSLASFKETMQMLVNFYTSVLPNSTLSMQVKQQTTYIHFLQSLLTTSLSLHQRQTNKANGITCKHFANSSNVL